MVYKTLFLLACFSVSALGQGAPTVAAMGYYYPAPVAVAPGQLITIFLSSDVQGDVSAAVQNLNAPVLEVGPSQACSPSPCQTATAVTIQIPYEISPGCGFTNPVCLVVVPTQLVVTVNGAASTPFDLMPQADRVHLLTSCDTVVPGASGMFPSNGLPCTPLVTHLDGSPVSANSPAVGQEILVAYAVGLGLTSPTVATGQAATSATLTANLFDLDFNFRPNALATKPPTPGYFPGSLLVPLYTGLTPGYVGLYQVDFIMPPVPAGVLACDGTTLSNLTVSLGGTASFDGAGICVAATN